MQDIIWYRMERNGICFLEIGRMPGPGKAEISNMECHGKKQYPGVSVGGKIYSLRMARRMTQEQLAGELCVSPAAVSKWERNLANPNIEMLWALADLFECTIDELVGRTVAQVERIGVYDEERLRLAAVAGDLMQCSKISRAEGLLAMEEAVPRLESGSRFLAFAVPYVMYAFMRQMDLEQTFGLLMNYAHALPEEERAEGEMIAGVLKLIFSGNGEEYIREYAASCIGMDYREKIGAARMGVELEIARKDIIARYKDQEPYSEATDLLEPCGSLGDFETQAILRNLESDTLTKALKGASGRVVTKFLSNLSDRLMYYISEDMERWQGTEEEILAAQRRVLEVGAFCLGP